MLGISISEITIVGGAMADGAVLAVGEPAEIQSHPEGLRAYLGD